MPPRPSSSLTPNPTMANFGSRSLQWFGFTTDLNDFWNGRVFSVDQREVCDAVFDCVKFAELVVIFSVFQYFEAVAFGIDI